MLITVVVTNKNYGDLVENAIISASNQKTDTATRIVVVDDGSTDDSSDIYRKYEGHIELIRTNGLGPAGAKNAAIRPFLKETDLFAFLDADDEYASAHCLPAFQSAFRHQDKVGLAYADCHMNDTVLACKYRVYKEPFSPARLMESDIVGGNFVVSAKALETVGMFDETMPVAETYDLVKRVTERFVAIHIPEYLIHTTRTGRALSVTVPQEEWEYHRQQSLTRARERPHVKK